MNTKYPNEEDFPEIRHTPESIDNEKYNRLSQNTISSQILDLFRSVAFQKGQYDLCRDIYQERKVWISDNWMIAVYTLLFVVNAFLVYRGIADVIKDLPFIKSLGSNGKYVQDIIGFILGGLLGISIEIAIGRVIFVKLSLKWFCDSKMLMTLKQMRVFGRTNPIHKYRCRGQVEVCRDIFSDYLMISFGVFDIILSFFCFVGLSIDTLGAKKTIDQIVKEIVEGQKRNYPADLNWLDAINFVPALLPAAIILIVSICLGYLVYFPKELSELLRRFTRKINGFDVNEIRYLVECNNELCEYISQKPDLDNDIDKNEIRKIQLQHEIRYLKEKRARCLNACDEVMKQINLNGVSPEENETNGEAWLSSINKMLDDEISIDLKSNTFREDTRLKVRLVTQQIKELVQELDMLNSHST